MFDEKNRLAKAWVSAKQISNLSPSETFRMMVDMNRAMNKFCIISIKKEKPSISKKALVKELRRVYAL